MFNILTKSDYIQKISDYFFYLFIFALPWQTIYFLREPFMDGEKWHYGVIGIYLNSFFLVVWIILELFLQRKNLVETFSEDRKIFCLTIVYWMVIGISVLQAINKMLSIYFWIVVTVGLISFWLLKKSNINIEKIILVFAFTATVQGIFALSQFYFQDTFSNKWLGLEKHEIWQGGTAVIENSNGRWLRAYGSFSHPNILGGYLFLAFILVLGGYLYFAKNKKERIFLLTLLIIIFTGLIVSFSRSSWLTFVLINLFLLFYFLIKKEFNYLKKVSIVYIFLLLFFSFFFSLNKDLFLTRVKMENRLEQQSILERTVLINESKDVIKENWLLGVGLGNYTLFSYQNDLEQRPIWQHQPVHNIYLLIWSELGIFGFLIFGFLISVVIFKNVNFLKIEKNNYKIFLLLNLFGLLIIGLFDHWIYSFYFGIIIFWILFGFLYKDKI